MHTRSPNVKKPLLVSVKMFRHKKIAALIKNAAIFNHREKTSLHPTDITAIRVFKLNPFCKAVLTQLLKFY